MKGSDVVKQLMAGISKQTNQFTTELSVTSLTSSGTTATVGVIAHGLGVGDLLSIVGSRVDAPIASIDRVDNVATVETSVDHDLTFDRVQSAELNAVGKTLTIEIDGANEPEFNGTFELLSVDNRTHFTFRVDDSGPTSSTGSPFLLDGVALGYNGTFNVVSVPDVDTLSYTTVASDLPDGTGTIILRKNFRIGRTVDFDRAEKIYTKQNTDDLVAFVEISDVAASKDRKTESDATANLGRGNSTRQQLIFPFVVYIFVNTTEELSGSAAKDLMTDVRGVLFKSLIGKVFSSGLACESSNAVVFVGDGTLKYDTATYVHMFQFETVADITFGDSIGVDDNVAFRDIDLGFDPNFDLVSDGIPIDFPDAKVSTGIDLDVDPE